MIYYISSTKYQNLLAQIIRESEESVLDYAETDRFELLSFVKSNMSIIDNLEILLIDLTACKDEDNGLVQAIENIRMVNNKIRLIVFDPTRYEGDKVLSKYFASGIYDIIVTDDNVQLKEELLSCIKSGREYKDATAFKDYVPYVEYQAKRNLKPDAEDIVIGLCGTHARIGVTHNLILLGNTLRKMGYLVALVDVSQNSSFSYIREEYDCLDKAECFSLDGMDYYSVPDINKIKGKGYNFILIDFGEYLKRDKEMFSYCDFRLIIAGVKPWEVGKTYNVFRDTLEEELKKYHYYFNFVSADMREDVRQGMGLLENIHFLKYVEDPFNSGVFPDIEDLTNRYNNPDSDKKKRKLR